MPVNKVIVCTVGGSHEPIVTALRDVRPDHVIFMCPGKDPTTGRPGSETPIVGTGNIIPVGDRVLQRLSHHARLRQPAVRHVDVFFNDETLKTFLFGATIDTDGLRNCYLLPAKTGGDVPPCVLSCRDPQWKAIVGDLQRHSRAFGTQFTARGDAIEVRGEK